MGKKRAVSIRRISEILMTRCLNGFTSDFEENKRIVSEMMHSPSKTRRNKIAGYITHYIQNSSEEKDLSEASEM